MITQIEIDGFKTFKDFKVELAPFQVIVGANASGKSNLFDALQLLSRLATMDLRSAFQDLRGEPDELFTSMPTGSETDKIRIAVEMLVNPTVKDNLGREETLQYRRLRYEVEVTRGNVQEGDDALTVTFETLRSIPSNEDSWCQKYAFALLESNPSLSEVTRKDFIFTMKPDEMLLTFGPSFDLSTSLIGLHEDGRGQEFLVGSPMAKKTMSWSSVLWGVANTEYPHAFAVRQELRTLRFFHFEPSMLREPNSLRSPGELTSSGEYLASTLARMQREDKFVLNDVSRDMANLVPGILEIRVERDKIGDRYIIYAKTTDKRDFSSQVLSDGTLRLLALAALKNDPQLHGILCLEEPENGVSPLHLKNMARLLRKMATDLNDASNLNEPLCQVLVTTHSPLFISQPDVIDSLLLAIMPTRVQGKANPVQVTRMEPVITPATLSRLKNANHDDKANDVYTIDVVKDYLDSELLDAASEQLENSRQEISER
jgi:predicted ATPase